MDGERVDALPPPGNKVGRQIYFSARRDAAGKLRVKHASALFERKYVRRNVLPPHLPVHASHFHVGQ